MTPVVIGVRNVGDGGEKADPSLTTPKLKKTFGAPCAQDDTLSIWMGSSLGSFPRSAPLARLLLGYSLSPLRGLVFWEGRFPRSAPLLRLLLGYSLAAPTGLVNGSTGKVSGSFLDISYPRKLKTILQWALQKRVSARGQREDERLNFIS